MDFVFTADSFGVTVLLTVVLMVLVQLVLLMLLELVVVVSSDVGTKLSRITILSSGHDVGGFLKSTVTTWETSDERLCVFQIRRAKYIVGFSMDVSLPLGSASSVLGTDTSTLCLE